MIRPALSCVDFCPTILRLMGCEATGHEEGRDASALLTTGRTPPGWKDIAFMRGTGGPDDNWLAAVTSRYKLVYGPKDEPWLFDLREDPDELINFYKAPAYRHVVRQLAEALRDYGTEHGDGRIENTRIRAELEAVL